MRRSTAFGMGLGVTLMVAFGVLVWPTSYRYTELQGYPVRINRFTGCTELFNGSDWLKRGATCTKPAPKPHQIRYQLFAKVHNLLALGNNLTGTASVVMNIMSVNLYNGTSCTLQSGSVFLKVGAEGRNYSFSGADIGPQSKGTVEIPVLNGPTANEKWTWQLMSATFDLPIGTDSCG